MVASAVIEEAEEVVSVEAEVVALAEVEEVEVVVIEVEEVDLSHLSLEWPLVKDNLRCCEMLAGE